jgi:hypothetical protein
VNLSFMARIVSDARRISRICRFAAIWPMRRPAAPQ